MKIITWNCCGGFHDKAKRIAKERPDVLAVQEVERMDDISFFPEEAQPFYWHCERLRPQAKKAIGMFSYTDIKLTFLDMMPGVRRYEAQKGGEIFNIMAVWTSKATPPRKDYRQLHDALAQIDVAKWVRQRPTLVLGDFNQSAKYRSDGWKMLKELTDGLGLVSAYHQFFDEKFGKETRPTHFHQGNEGKPFHLDYCFLPKEWIPMIERVKVGSYSKWGQVSDHVPLTVDL